MNRPAAFVFALLALGALAQGSTVESSVYGVCYNSLEEPVADELCHYQADGGAHGDASDDCAQPAPALTLGAQTEGAVFPPVPPVDGVPSEDPGDNYALDVGVTLVNVPLYVTLLPGTRWSPLNEGPVAYDLAVYGPVAPAGCLTPLVADGTASTPWRGTTLAFSPPVAGTYTVQATVSDLHLAKLESEIPVSCHFMCFQEVNRLVGYRLLVNDTPPI